MTSSSSSSPSLPPSLFTRSTQGLLNGKLRLELASFEKVKEVDEFFKVHPDPSITRTLKQSIERVQINAKWVQSVGSEKNLADIVKELAHRKY